MYREKLSIRKKKKQYDKTTSHIHHIERLRSKKYLIRNIGTNNVLTIQKAKLALKT